MTLACPDCGGSLAIRSRIELPSDSRSDEIAVQILECPACNFKGVGVYEESRRGAEDSWDHTSHRLPAGELEALAGQIARYPNPADARCGCPTHAALGRRDESGRWAGVEGLGSAAPIRLAADHAQQPRPVPVSAPAPARMQYRRRLPIIRLMLAFAFFGGLFGGMIGMAIGDDEGGQLGMILGAIVGMIGTKFAIPPINRWRNRPRLVSQPAPAPTPPTPPKARPRPEEMPTAEDARQLAMKTIAERRRASGTTVSSPETVTSAGYDYARAGRRGFAQAEGVLQNIRPTADESPRAYLDRVKDGIRALRDEARRDTSDEDGATSGALDAALWAVNDAWGEMPEDPI